MDPLSVLIPVTLAPSGGTVGAAGPDPTAVTSPTVVTSTAGASVGSTAAPAAACSLAWFGDTSCITLGSTTIGTTTAMVLGAALVAGLMYMFGGKR
jgi:hypothetical protein